MLGVTEPNSAMETYTDLFERYRFVASLDSFWPSGPWNFARDLQERLGILALFGRFCT
jgi:hypothetical protein